MTSSLPLALVPLFALGGTAFLGFAVLSLNSNQLRHERRREELGRFWEHQLWGCASVWQLNVALGSELIPRKSKEFGTLKAVQEKGICGQ